MVQWFIMFITWRDSPLSGECWKGCWSARKSAYWFPGLSPCCSESLAVITWIKSPFTIPKSLSGTLSLSKISWPLRLKLKLFLLPKKTERKENWHSFNSKLSSMEWYWEQVSMQCQINRPFHWYGGHIELIRFKEYCAWERSSILTSIYVHFSGQHYFSLSFPTKRLLGKKIIVPCLDVIMIAFFLWIIQWSSLFTWKACVNTEQVPPWHPIILLKSNKFNMATVSVKRSIAGVPMSPCPSLKGRGATWAAKWGGAWAHLELIDALFI